MTVFLVLIVIILFAVAIWQMNKIYALSKGNSSGESGEVANGKDNRINAKLMVMFMVFLYFLMFYCFWHYSKFYLPEASSAHGSKYDNLMFISIALIMVVQIITQFLLHFFAYKYKGKKGQRALFYADNDKLEFIWTIIPVIVLAGLIIYGLFTWSDIMNFDEDEDALVVELYAQRFNWKARYAGEDNILGDANVRFIEGINQLGIDPSDVDGQDDVVTQELHLPVGRQVIFKLRSQDVLHSAYMPHFRAQMNVVPGMITQFSFTPTVTTEEIRKTDYMQEKMRTIQEIRKEKSKELVAAGEPALDDYDEFDYYLLCNKICGESHYNMQMKIIVESQEDYEKWIKTQKTFEASVAQ
ncbi:cytochrome c oxidase subunit II [Leeuwenhoekiella polynyae]|uniref:Cytochrome c oxidase subunit 2 n=1 Tax=Leeuwenhoekiella polynyae TaxID=1550906 RepID=A0A4V1KQ10_9FLAO|nr:cytochrome c oxidase subunit II [Leeuwenhoekiella polynyae]RXG18562.1 cytochrome c oxidase subunit 2 [Leeuwenhoekiella polynyae]